MREISEERRRLTDMYYGLKERLDKLNDLEMKGIGDLSIKGYVDLYNSYNKEVAVTNIKREAEHAVKKTEEVFTPKEEKKLIPMIEIEKQKEKESAKIVSSRSSYLNVDKVISIIASLLKDNGVPMDIKTIHKKIESDFDMVITEQNLRNNIMRKAMMKNKRIQRATRGFYQYIA